MQCLSIQVPQVIAASAKGENKNKKKKDVSWLTSVDPLPFSPTRFFSHSSTVPFSLQHRAQSRLNARSTSVIVHASNVGVGSAGYDGRQESDEQNTVAADTRNSSTETEKSPYQIPYPLSIALVLCGCGLVFSLIAFSKGNPSSVLGAIAKSGFTAAFSLIFVSEIGDKVNALAEANITYVHLFVCSLQPALCNWILNACIKFSPSYYPEWSYKLVVFLICVSILLLYLSPPSRSETFFIAALLAMQYKKVLIVIGLGVLLGSMGALSLMTVLSVVIGRIFNSVPAQFQTTVPVGEYAAIALLLFFGLKSIKDAWDTPSAPAKTGDKSSGLDEFVEAEELVKEKVSIKLTKPLEILWKSFSLVFFAEWGDRSMLATIALGAAQSPWGVAGGAIVGHFVATSIAVVGGALLANYISEKLVGYIGGALFILFAVATFFGVF